MASLKTTVGEITDQGLNPKRGVNEDNLLALPDRGLFLVADGVGGRRGGQVASQTVVDVFKRVFSQDHPDDLKTVILSTIDLCNQKIYEESESNPELVGMATTIAMVAIQGRQAFVAHVGDSRVYRFDDHGLVVLTEDHSEVNDAIRAGTITPEQAATHPRRNVINRAVGAEPEVEPDIIEIDIDEKTSFLICSDGITRHVSDDQIAALMKSGRRPEEICETLKEICYEGGAEDNLTAIVVDLGHRDYVEEPTRPAIAKARAASGATGSIPRQARRIEVDLTGSPDDRTSTGGPGSATWTTEPDSESAGIRNTFAAEAGSAVSEASGASIPEKGPEKGGMSEIMKWSILILTLVAGIVLGSLIGRPLVDRFVSIFGGADPNAGRGNQSVEADPETSAAFARFAEGHSGEARERLNAVLAANPKNAEAHFYMGRIDYTEGRYEDAINHYGEASKLNPGLPDIQIHLALAYLSIGQMRNARDTLQHVVSPGSAVSAPSPSMATSPTPETTGGVKPNG